MINRISKLKVNKLETFEDCFKKQWVFEEYCHEYLWRNTHKYYDLLDIIEPKELVVINENLSKLTSTEWRLIVKYLKQDNKIANDFKEWAWEQWFWKS